MLDTELVNKTTYTLSAECRYKEHKNENNKEFGIAMLLAHLYRIRL
jgi:hypothetical protein